MVLDSKHQTNLLPACFVYWPAMLSMQMCWRGESAEMGGQVSRQGV